MRGRWLKLGGLLLSAIILLCGFSPEVYAETEKEVMETIVPVYHYLQKRKLK